MLLMPRRESTADGGSTRESAADGGSTRQSTADGGSTREPGDQHTGTWGETVPLSSRSPFPSGQVDSAIKAGMSGALEAAW